MQSNKEVDVTVSSHPDTQANSLSNDAFGKLCALGGRSTVTIIDLQKPSEILKRTHLGRTFDITRLLWNPASTHHDFIIITYFQAGDVWKIQSDGTCFKYAPIKGHTRAISDIDWSANADSFATSSIDTYINIWDIREIKKPKLSMSTVAGASHIKWNKNNTNFLASSHEGDIRVWDIRKHSTPVQCISAHLSKIYSLDWNPCEPFELVSAGEDTTVRFWDTSEQAKYPITRMHAGAPVWKARYTPDGFGIVTALRPQLLKWEENSLLLWNKNDVSKPQKSFLGHRDVIVDIDWSCVSSENKADCQIVTWGKDQTLRIWPYVVSNLTEAVLSPVADNFMGMGINEDDETTVDIESTQPVPSGFIHEYSHTHSRNSSYGGALLSPNDFMSPMIGLTIPDASDRPQDLFLTGSSSPYMGSSPSTFGKHITPSPLFNSMVTAYNSLDGEIRFIQYSYSSWMVEKIDDGQNRACHITLKTQNHSISLMISFPFNYPNGVAPEFQFMPQTTLPQQAKQKLLNMLKETSQQQVQNNRFCLDVCLRNLLHQIDNINPGGLMKRPSFHTYHSYSPYSDVNIPFSRTSGAKFGPSGHLVYFMRPVQVKGFEKNAVPTPRSLAAILNHTVGYSKEDSVPFHEYSVKQFLYKEKRPSRKSTKQREGSGDGKLQMRLHKAAGKVMYIDLSTILLVNKTLASMYIVPSDENFKEACQHNRLAASKVGRKDLVQLWSNLEILPPTSDNLEDFPFYVSFGREFLEKKMDHYSALNDVQTLAMLSCIFARNKPEVYESQTLNHLNRKWSYNSLDDEDSGSNISNSYHDTSHAKTLSSPESIGKNLLPRIDLHFSSDYNDASDAQPCHVAQLLPIAHYQLYETFKMKYYEILDQWHLLSQKADIRKYILNQSFDENYMVCDCGYSCEENSCSNCRWKSKLCTICEQPVRKLASVCRICCHGGHRDHIKLWFEDHTTCPAGCGCQCVGTTVQ